MATEDFGFSSAELRKFSESGRVISAAIGASVELWARAEAGVILKTWAGRTKVATAAGTTTRARKRALRGMGLTGQGGALVDVTINAGVKGPYGRVFLRTKDGHWRRTHEAGFRPVNGYRGQSTGDHYSTYHWLSIKSAIAEAKIVTAKAVKEALKSIGLARQSIIQIADELGIRLENVKGGGSLSSAGIAKARAALAANGTWHRNGVGYTQKTAEEFSLTLVNRYPKLGKVGMDRVFIGVIAGRMKYFQKNLEEGVFLSAKNTARAYPYLEVLRTAA
jgi:hypothetical protein